VHGAEIQKSNEKTKKRYVPKSEELVPVMSVESVLRKGEKSGGKDFSKGEF